MSKLVPFVVMKDMISGHVLEEHAGITCTGREVSLSYWSLFSSRHARQAVSLVRGIFPDWKKKSSLKNHVEK